MITKILQQILPENTALVATCTFISLKPHAVNSSSKFKPQTSMRPYKGILHTKGSQKRVKEIESPEKTRSSQRIKTPEK